MADLTILEKRQLERLLQMGGGYVLNFSNRTLQEFVTDSVARHIYDARLRQWLEGECAARFLEGRRQPHRRQAAGRSTRLRAE
jgi:hypothetical protein